MTKGRVCSTLRVWPPLKRLLKKYSHFMFLLIRNKSMKKVIIYSNVIATILFFWFVGSLGSEDTSTGVVGFFIFIIPFLFIMALINLILYVIFRVTNKKE
jgi:hypothetical protein